MMKSLFFRKNMPIFKQNLVILQAELTKLKKITIKTIKKQQWQQLEKSEAGDQYSLQ